MAGFEVWGFSVEGAGFGRWGSGVRVQGAGFEVLTFGYYGLQLDNATPKRKPVFVINTPLAEVGSRVEGLGIRVQGLGFGNWG